MNSPSSSVNMLAQQVRAWVSARPLQPSVASQYKTTAIPRRRLAVREKEQGRLPRIAACGVTVEVALRLYCHAGGGSRGVDEKLDRRVGLRARVLRCTAPPQAFWRSPGMARWLTKCAGDKNNQQQRKIHCPAPTAQSSPARHLFVRPFSSLPARHMAQCLSMDLSPSRAALPCTFAALTRPHGPHTINQIHSSPGPGRGCMKDMLKRRYMGGRGLQTTTLLGCMIGQAQRPRYVVIVFLYCPTALSCPLLRHAHLRCTLFTTPPHPIHDLRFFFVPPRSRAGTPPQLLL